MEEITARMLEMKQAGHNWTECYRLLNIKRLTEEQRQQLKERFK